RDFHVTGVQTCALPISLPLNLHGLKGPELFGSVYMSRDRLTAWRAGTPDPIRWVVVSPDGIQDWARAGEVSATEAPFRITDGERSEEHTSELQSRENLV